MVAFGGGANFEDILQLTMSNVTNSTECIFTNNIATDIQSSVFEGSVVWNQEDNDCEHIREKYRNAKYYPKKICARFPLYLKEKPE